MPVNKNYCADKVIAIVGFGQIGQAFLTLSKKYYPFSHYIVIDSEAHYVDGIDFYQCDIEDDSIAPLIKKADMFVSCLPWQPHKKLMEMAVLEGVPIFGVARIDYNEAEKIESIAKERTTVLLNGCGLEPGLSEIFCNYLAQSYVSIDKINVYCGGVPLKPTPPLGYRLTYDAQHLPFSKRVTYRIKQSQLLKVERFSEVEPVKISEIGILEGFNDGLLPWRLKFAKRYATKEYTQKTLRWPGYATVVNFLNDADMLNEDNIQGGSCEHTYRKLIERKLIPQLKSSEKEDNVTILFIKVMGSETMQKNKIKSLLLIAHNEQGSNISSMAMITALPLLFIINKYAEEQRPPLTSRPENYLNYKDIENLIGILRNCGIKIIIK